MQHLTRRHVLATLSSSAVMLCPAILNAQAAAATDWGDIPTNTPVGQDQMITLDAGPTTLEISELNPGDVAVVARPNSDPKYTNTNLTQYIAVMRRTDAQIAFGTDNDRTDTVQDSRYLVVDLLCPHRGKAVGITGNPDAPFACTDRGSRHSSVFDASGFGVGGASKGDPMSVPAYSIDVTENAVVLQFS